MLVKGDSYMRVQRLSLIVIAVAVLAIDAGAATKRPVKIEDFARLQDLADPQVSPNSD